MARERNRPRVSCEATRERGVTLIELLVSLVVIGIGLLGIMQLYAKGQTSELEAQQRGQAILLVNDMIDRMNANRSAVDCYDISTGASATTYLGTGNTTTFKCSGVDTSATRAVADSDLADWGTQLDEDGGLVGGRGCITKDTSGTSDEYTVVIAWQGRSFRDDPSESCASGQYGGTNSAGESQRRTISRSLRIADLD